MANPDSPEWPVRQRALEDGKVVYMAVPKLAEENPFRPGTTSPWTWSSRPTSSTRPAMPFPGRRASPGIG